MKAITYNGIKKVEYKSVEDPKIIDKNDVIIKVTSSAICGSDLHLYHGMVKSMLKGYILGHEAMGIVIETGSDVKRIRKGDRIVVPFPIACGHCVFCHNNLWTMCDNTNEYGEISGIYGSGKIFGNYNGGQAEYLRVLHADVNAVKIDDKFNDEQVLFISDILPTSYWGALNGGVKHGDTVVILGCGPVGLLTIKWCGYFGVDRVIAVDRVNYRLKQASKYGAETVNIDCTKDAGEYVKEITHGGADVVIDCVGMGGKISALEFIETLLMMQGGSKSAIELASQSVRKGGTVSIVGDYGTRYNSFPLGDFFARFVTLKMGQCPAQNYTKDILQLINEGKIDATDIITHIIPLKKGEYAYNIFDKKIDNCIKVVLKP